MKKFTEKIKNTSKKKKRIMLLIVLAIFLILASLYTVVIRPKLKEEKIIYTETKVERGQVSVNVNESGSITYKQSSIKYDLDLDVSDDDEDEDDEDEETTVKYLVIEEVYKAPGEIVSEGDELLKFSEKSIESVRKILDSAVADAKVDYNDAKSEYELDCLSAEVDYNTCLINAGYAKKIYNDAYSEVSNNIQSIQAEISYREGRVDSLNETLEEAAEDYFEALDNYNKEIESLQYTDPSSYSGYVDYQRNYLNVQNAYYNAISQYERAEQAISDNEEQIKKLKAELKKAQASKTIDSISVKKEYEETVQSGDNAYLSYQATLESLKETLKEAEDTLKEREEQKEAFEELVGEDGIVRIDKEGMIVSVNVEEGDKLTNELEMVTYVCAKDLTISVDVTEEDVVNLAIGEPVKIVLTAYPDEEYEGEIISIDTTATSTDTNTVSYPVVVSLEGIISKMYGGMTAKVSFEVASAEDTLFISRKALVEQGGNYYVYVKQGVADYELKKVSIGLKNTSYVEIKEGLSEDDTIYIVSTGARN